MPFTSIVRSGARLAAVTPALWLYGLISASLGGAVMVAALLAAFPRYDEPIGRGLLGWLILGAVMAVSLAAEAGACRSAARGMGTGDAVAASARLLPRGAALVPALIVVAIFFCLIVAVPVFTFLRSFLNAVLLVVFPFATHVTIILGSAMAGLALLVPAWMMVPLAVRGVGIHDRGVWESIGDAMTAIGERGGAAAGCALLCVGLDAALLIGGERLAARDLSLTGRLHVLAAWTGTRLGAGVLILALTALAAAFKAGLWTALYLDVARQQKWDDSSRPPVAHGDSMRLGVSARRAASGVWQSPTLLLLAAAVVLIGMPTTADLLSAYQLIPLPAFNPTSYVTRQIPGGGATLIYLFVPALLVSLFCESALIAATRPLTPGQEPALSHVLGTALRRLAKVIGALIMTVCTVGLVGAMVLVGVLFAMALVVQYAKGLDQVADQFGKLVAMGVVAVAVMLTPFVMRAALLDGAPGGKALSRGFDVATARPRLTVLTFLLTASLEVLRGPVARRAGMMTSGWSELFALSGGVHPPLPRVTLALSAGALLLSTVAVAFAARLWTEVYDFAASHVAEEQPSDAADSDGSARKQSGRKKRATRA